nr:Mut7-C RNAse domain-containing protein [Sulfolobus islandicus]
MGYDTLYSNDLEDWKILKIAETQKRIIVTRDRGIYNRSLKKGIKLYSTFTGFRYNTRFGFYCI